MNKRHVIENDYLYGENIKYAMVTDSIPQKLSALLVKKFHLINEAQVVEHIERAVLSYYSIELSDLQSIDSNVLYDAYVYVYLNPSISGKWHIYGNEYVYNMPIYVGKGQGDRKTSHLHYAANSNLASELRKLRNNHQEPIIKVYNNGCTHEMAFNLENYIIARLREQEVILCNKTQQTDVGKYVREIEVTSFNLETALNSILLDALNNTRTFKEAASMLGISERTLYRKMKTLRITKTGSIFHFSDVLSDNTLVSCDGTISDISLSELKIEEKDESKE